MPLYPDASPPPRQDREDQLPPQLTSGPATSAMRVLNIGGVPLYVTFAVPVAIAAGIAVMVLVSRHAPLGISAAVTIGVAFWGAGCVLQLISYLTAWTIAGEPGECVTLGLLGIEFPTLHLGPRRLIGLAALTILPLAIAAVASMVAGIVVAGETPWLSDQGWHLPSLGGSAADAMWQSGGVLLLIQMLCQCFPLPRTPGRQIVLACIAGSLRHLDLTRIVLVARRCFIAMALLTAMLAIGLIPWEIDSPVGRWPILLLIAVMLWVSSRGDDVPRTCWALVNAESANRGPIQQSWFGRLAQNACARSGRRRVQKALERERGEAVDASKLDEILMRLHEQGIASLSNDDRAVLRCVSESLRTQSQPTADSRPDNP